MSLRRGIGVGLVVHLGIFLFALVLETPLLRAGWLTEDQHHDLGSGSYLSTAYWYSVVIGSAMGFLTFRARYSP